MKTQSKQNSQTNFSLSSSIKSFIAIFSLLILFIISISHNIILTPSELCNKNETCLYNLITDTKNTSICDVSTNQTNCYEKFAYKFKNNNLCDKTSNKTICITNIAIQTKSVYSCTELLDSTNSDNCIFQLSTTTNESILCELTHDKPRCYYSYAIYSQNESLCEKTEKYEKLCNSKFNPNSTN